MNTIGVTRTDFKCKTCQGRGSVVVGLDNPEAGNRKVRRMLRKQGYDSKLIPCPDCEKKKAEEVKSVQEEIKETCPALSKLF